MASSGSFTTTAREGRSLTFSWSIQSQSIANNTTTISWNLKGSGSYTYGWVACGGFKVVINGSTVYEKGTDYRINVYSGTTVASGTHTISHNNDGSKTFSASAQAGIYEYAVNCSGSGSWALTTIPRASSITSASNVTLGNKCGITFTPASTSFQYDIRFSLGSWAVSTGKFKPGITSAYTYNYYTIPNDYNLLSQIPNSTTGTMTATLTTYNSSGTQIGSTSSKTFTVTVPSSVVPTVGTITLNPVDINSRNILVQGKNKLTISVSGCTAGTGSLIKSYTFSGPGISSTTTSTSVTSGGTISNTGTLTYTVKVTDNRGRTASKTATIPCYAYSAPTITLNAYRVASSSSTTANNDGSYVRCTYNLSYASVNGSNKPTIKIYYKQSTATNLASTQAFVSSTTSGTSGTINATGSCTLSSISANDTYTIYATIADNYGGNTSSLQITIFGAERILNIRPGGKGIAFGKMSSTNNVLDSKWPIRSDDPIRSMQNLSYRGLDLISSTTNDTIVNWNNQGNLATTFYTQTGQINGQPSQYGFLLNLTTGPGSTEAHQLWLAQNNGDVSHRGGNHSGMSTSWKTILDSSNYTSYVATKPTTLFSSSSGTTGTITLSQSADNFTYLEIFYSDNNSRQQNSARIYSPNGRYVSLSSIEPSTNGSSPALYVRSSGWTISGTSMTAGRSDLNGKNVGVYGVIYPHAGGTNIDINVTANSYIKIFRILGYK